MTGYGIASPFVLAPIVLAGLTRNRLLIAQNYENLNA
jgi:hypothetical protein